MCSQPEAIDCCSCQRARERATSHPTTTCYNALKRNHQQRQSTGIKRSPTYPCNNFVRRHRKAPRQIPNKKSQPRQIIVLAEKTLKNKQHNASSEPAHNSAALSQRKSCSIFPGRAKNDILWAKYGQARHAKPKILHHIKPIALSLFPYLHPNTPPTQQQSRFLSWPPSPTYQTPSPRLSSSVKPTTTSRPPLPLYP